VIDFSFCDEALFWLFYSLLQLLCSGRLISQFAALFWFFLTRVADLFCFLMLRLCSHSCTEVLLLCSDWPIDSPCCCSLLIGWFLILQAFCDFGQELVDLTATTRWTTNQAKYREWDSYLLLLQSSQQ
jgi:hypothetical protein